MLGRPRIVFVIAGLMATNVLLLILYWLFWPMQIESYGSQVFFMFFYGSIGWVLYQREGWLRYWLIVALVLVILSWINNGDGVVDGFSQDNWVEMWTKLSIAVVVILSFIPKVHRWYQT